MRLDRLLTHLGVASRTEAARAARAGEILVDGVPVRRADVSVDPEKQRVVFRGETLQYAEFVWIMMHKPQGVLSATEDGKGKTVIDLLPDRLRRRGLFPCGRLDKDTTGLLLLTNDGALAHRLLSPKHHVEKVYHYVLAAPFSDENRFENGIELDGGYHTKPASVRCLTSHEGEITLTEGKYHQIKRMFEAVGNRVVGLSRLSFAGIPLDPALKPGEFRPLTQEEIALLLAGVQEETSNH